MKKHKLNIFRTKRKVAQIAFPIILLMQWMSLFSCSNRNISVSDTVADLSNFRTTMEDSEVNDLMKELDQFRKVKTKDLMFLARMIEILTIQLVKSKIAL